MKLREKSNLDIFKENNQINPLAINVADEKHTRAVTRSVLEIIAKTLSGTLGPYGTTTIIQDRQGAHFASKDGLDLLSRLSFHDEVARTILEIVRKIGNNQVFEVGDGSTSAIIIANALYSALTDPNNADQFAGASPKDIVDILNDVASYLEDEIPKVLEPYNGRIEVLEQIATVATNNDRNTGKFISEVYKEIGEYGFITTDCLKKGDSDSVEYIKGVTWNRGYVGDYNDAIYKRESVTHKEPVVFITTEYLTYDDIEPYIFKLMGYCIERSKEFVIIANGFDQSIIHFFATNRQRNLSHQPIIFTPVDVDVSTANSRDMIEDISLLAGCEVFSRIEHGDEFADNIAKFVGDAKEITITRKNTNIIFGKLSDEKEAKAKDNEDAILSRVEELMNLSDPDEKDDVELYNVKKRLSAYRGGSAIIHVGGKTDTEKTTRERLIEDAIFACRSTMNNGYIIGGNIVIPRILDSQKDKITSSIQDKYKFSNLDISKIVDTLKFAFLESYRTVLENSYISENKIEEILETCVNEKKFFNLKTHSYEEDSECTVINSVRTDIEILRSCMSIISILATSNQFITINQTFI